MANEAALDPKVDGRASEGIEPALPEGIEPALPEGIEPALPPTQAIALPTTPPTCCLPERSGAELRACRRLVKDAGDAIRPVQRRG